MRIPKTAVFGGLAVVLAAVSGFGIYSLYTRGYFDKSTARISEDNGLVAIDFSIAKKDRPAAEKLSTDLGIDTSWENGLKFGIDQSTLNNFKNDLPVNLTVSFKGKEISFQSNGFKTALESGLSGKDYNFATGSGSLKLTEADPADFSFQVENPGDLLREATSSGQVFISKQTEGLLELSGKVSTMDLKVNSGSVAGDIKFR